ncbi:ATP-dependent DNA helicase PcrA, partial [bacterium LRH843]|nr:ATP-dependent DNA helicase PcrA [bacterium LRH843]
MLKIEGETIGIPKNFVIYDEDDRRGLVKQAMKQRGLNDRQMKPNAISAAISNAKNQLQSPSDLKAAASYPFEKAVADVYADYEVAK